MWKIFKKKPDHNKDYVKGTGKKLFCKRICICFFMKFKNYKKFIEIDKKLFRPAEVDLLKG